MKREFASPMIKGSLNVDEDIGVYEVRSAIDGVYDIGESLVVILKRVQISTSRPMLLLVTFANMDVAMGIEAKIQRRMWDLEIKIYFKKHLEGKVVGLRGYYCLKMRYLGGYRQWEKAIIYGTSYKKAAALVNLANDESGMPLEILDIPDIQTVAKFYFVYVRFNIIWTLNYFALITLSYFEKPLWCGSLSKVSCNNRHYYYLGGLPYLTSQGSLAFESVTFLILVVHILFPILYEGRSVFWRNHVNKLKVILLLILAADLVVYILYLSPVAIDTLPFRIAPYLRIVFFILYIRNLRDSLVVLAGMLGTYLNVLVLCLLFLLFSSWLAYVIFEHTQQGTTFFSSYPATLYQLFVLFTTSNNPDVWIPAYNSSRWSSLFFVLFMLLGVYFLTNLVLAVVYEGFECGGSDYLNSLECINLFEQLKDYRMLPYISEEEYVLIFDTLDSNHDFKIDAAEFNQLLNVISIKFQKEESEPWLSRYPFYNSLYSEMLKGFVKSPKFKYVIVFVLLLNLAALIAETRLDIQNTSGHKSWQKADFVFAWIYLFEVALRVYTHGFVNYWNNSNNRFNFIFTWVIVIGETLTIVSPKELKFFSNEDWIRYLLIARILRFIRLVMHVQRYHTFVDTFLHLIPSLMPYLGTIFCVMCIYCTLGIQIFGGLVNAGNSDLPSTDLAHSNYLSFNFNDYPNGMVTLFNIMVLGSWQVWMKGYVTLTGTSWTYTYFISFYLITVLLLLNLIVAFVLQAFFAEIDLRSSLEEEDGERSSTSGRRRKVGTKTSSEKFNMLIRRMLEKSQRLKERLNKPETTSA